jgi:hypothetical protein
MNVQKVKVPDLDHTFDQNRLCCGALCDAVVIDETVILQCLGCGLAWEKRLDGSLAPIAAYDPARRQRRSQKPAERLDGDEPGSRL